MTESVVENYSVFVLDDQASVADVVVRCLRRLPLTARAYEDPLECLRDVEAQKPDIVITDIQMPEMDGISVLKRVKEIDPEIDVILVTGYADKATAINALKLGAFDFFEKPIARTQLVETIKRAIKYRALIKERDSLAEQVSSLTMQEAQRWGIDAFIGKSRVVRDVIADIRRLQKVKKTAVLVTGESGTGKELVARAIHFGSARASGPFIAINCSAVPDNLAESTMFGHVKGSFTGAISDRKGCFAEADGGTLFLDEIGDMDAAVQTKLLRVLEDGKITRVGEHKERHVDVRILAATNVDLREKIRAGRFRADLYHRLDVFSVHIASLRERKEDIPLFLHHFAEQLVSQMGVPPAKFGREVVEVLTEYGYPGNVRELKNIVERILIMSGGGEITVDHVRFLQGREKDNEAANGSAATPMATPAKLDLPETFLNLQEVEQVIIGRAMKECGGNISEAARLLGIGRTSLYRKLASIDLL